nr:hypothetical protein [Pelagirhabdus alkalitolerans]
MSRCYRYRLPPWCLKCLCVLETCLLPICIFQLIRTLIFPTSLDVLLLFLLVSVYVSFYMKWI